MNNESDLAIRVQM